MKRSEFFKSIGLGALAMAAVPLAGSNRDTMGDYVHDPEDYAFVSEEPEEFQELEVDVPEDWAEEEIIWI